ncbi:hypothetical protein PF008_g6431 [Phytophthora fragariae]|uniref:Uncharacterized protein n=1 Tax=Phytophthora fragariae TaxID=53985 RepID=A0A6G0S742_9STRA|nr:hypothetical protein PF008_g6431 [Phytophthora fragariae]
MGSGARRRRACFGPGTWNSPRHAETDDDGENLDAEMADGAAEENPPRDTQQPRTAERTSTRRWRATLQRRTPRDTQQPTTTERTSTRRWRTTLWRRTPPRHAVTDNGAEADDAAKEKDASFAFIADEGEANAAQKVYGEMSDDAEEMRDESSLVEGASGEAEDEKGDSSGEEDVGDESTGASTQDSVQDSVQDSDQDSDQERDCDPGSGVKGSARRVVVVVPRPGTKTGSRGWHIWMNTAR